MLKLINNKAPVFLRGFNLFVHYLTKNNFVVINRYKFYFDFVGFGFTRMLDFKIVCLIDICIRFWLLTVIGCFFLRIWILDLDFD